MKKRDALTDHAVNIHKDCPISTLKVLQERLRQDKKWGEQNHAPFVWLGILMEEVGELSQALLQTAFGGDKGGEQNIDDELVQVAAVALAMVECCHRNKWGSNSIHQATSNRD